MAVHLPSSCTWRICRDSGNGSIDSECLIEFWIKLKAHFSTGSCLMFWSAILLKKVTLCVTIFIHWKGAWKIWTKTSCKVISWPTYSMSISSMSTQNVLNLASVVTKFWLNSQLFLILHPSVRQCTRVWRNLCQVNSQNVYIGAASLKPLSPR